MSQEKDGDVNAKRSISFIVVSAHESMNSVQKLGVRKTTPEQKEGGWKLTLHNFGLKRICW